MNLYAKIKSDRIDQTKTGLPIEKGLGAHQSLKVELLIGGSKEQASAGTIELREIGPDVYEVFYHSSTSRVKSKVLNTISLKGTIFATAKR